MPLGISVLTSKVSYSRPISFDLDAQNTSSYPAAVCEEANLAFDLNTELFKTIQLVESTSTPQSKEVDDVLMEQTRLQTYRYSVAQFLPLIIAGMSV